MNYGITVLLLVFKFIMFYHVLFHLERGERVHSKMNYV